MNDPAYIIPRKLEDVKHYLKYVCGAIGIKDKEKQSYMFSSF